MIYIVSAALIFMMSQVKGATIIGDEYDISSTEFGQITDKGPDAIAALAYANSYCDVSSPFIPHLHANNETNCVIGALDTFYDQPRLEPSWICSSPDKFLTTHSPASIAISSVRTSISCSEIISDRFEGKVMPFRGPVTSCDCNKDVFPGHPMHGSYLMMLDLANYCCYDGWPNRNTVCDV